jgi:hypothetical protein
MPSDSKYGSSTRKLQPTPKFVPNPPAATAAQALANGKAQVNKAK